MEIAKFFPDLKGMALFDNINKQLENVKSLKVVCWQKRELENYFAKPFILIRFANSLASKYPYISSLELGKMMQESIDNFCHGSVVEISVFISRPDIRHFEDCIDNSEYHSKHV